MQQASRAADYVGYLHVNEPRRGELGVGELIEFGEKVQIFSLPQDKRTEGYVTGRFG